MKKPILFSLSLVFVLTMIVLLTSQPVQALVPAVPEPTSRSTPTPTSTPIPTQVPPTATFTSTPVPTSTPDTRTYFKPEENNGPAQGNWVWTDPAVTANVISTANLNPSTPNEWSRLQSNGLQISGRTQICHPFRGGQFGWHTSVFLLNGRTWVEILTTVEWYPDEEGKLMACAYAPVSGTYAMFGYWEWFDGFEKPIQWVVF